MLNANLYKAHLGVYWRTQRILLLIFSTVLLVNIALQTLIAYFVHGTFQGFDMAIILPTIVGVLAGVLIAIPIMEITSIPYLLTLGSRRKDMVSSATANNFLHVVLITMILSLLIGIYAVTSKNLAAIYMGTIITGWNSILTIGLFNLFLFLMITSVIFLIGTIFHRWGILWGLGVLFLTLSVPIFILKEFYHFFIWGGSYLAVCLGMLLLSILFFSLSRLTLAKAEVRHYRPKIPIKGFIFFACMVIIFSSSLYFGFNRLTSDTGTINNSGRFAYYDQGVNENSFYSEGNQNLHLSWRSRLDKGDLTLTIQSPSQEVVYTSSENTNDMVTIPLTEGEWSYFVTFDNASEGRYSIRCLIK